MLQNFQLQLLQYTGVRTSNSIWSASRNSEVFFNEDGLYRQRLSLGTYAQEVPTTGLIAWSESASNDQDEAIFNPVQQPHTVRIRLSSPPVPEGITSTFSTYNIKCFYSLRIGVTLCCAGEWKNVHFEMPLTISTKPDKPDNGGDRQDWGQNTLHRENESKEAASTALNIVTRFETEYPLPGHARREKKGLRRIADSAVKSRSRTAISERAKSCKENAR